MSYYFSFKKHHCLINMDVPVDYPVRGGLCGQAVAHFLFLCARQTWLIDHTTLSPEPGALLAR